jgi:phosphatidylglycerophosphate synthase
MLCPFCRFRGCIIDRGQPARGICGRITERIGAFVQTSEPVRRTSEIEEFTNLYLVHPFANRLTPVFAKLGISPNAVSLSGMALGLLAGFAYYHYRDLGYVIAGFILMIAWHVMDGADGQLARLTHAQSELGKILDGTCDYVTFLAVYSALAVALSREAGDWVWPWTLAIGAGLCHAAQAMAYEAQRQEYNFWGWDRKSAELLAPEALPPDDPNGSPASRVLHLIYRTYVRSQFQIAGGVVGFHKALAAALEAEPARVAIVRERYRAQFAPSVLRWSVMSANYRTLAIFVAALIGRPEYFFWFEIVALNLILIVLIYGQHARCMRFLKSLDA